MGVGSGAPDELQRAQTRVERPVPVAVAPSLALSTPLVPPGADRALHVRLHQQLHHGLGDAAQEIAVSGFGQQLG